MQRSSTLERVRQPRWIFVNDSESDTPTVLFVDLLYLGRQIFSKLSVEIRAFLTGPPLYSWITT